MVYEGQSILRIASKNVYLKKLKKAKIHSKVNFLLFIALIGYYLYCGYKHFAKLDNVRKVTIFAPKARRSRLVVLFLFARWNPAF